MFMNLLHVVAGLLQLSGKCYAYWRFCSSGPLLPWFYQFNQDFPYIFYRISSFLAETLLVTHAADLRRGSLLKSIVLSDIYMYKQNI